MTQKSLYKIWICLYIILIVIIPMVFSTSDTLVTISPENINDPSLSVGDQFEIIISFTDAQNVQFSSLSLQWDPAKIIFVEAFPEPGFGGAIALVGGLNQTTGTISTLTNNRLSSGFTGDTDWYRLVWEIVESGESDIEITQADLRDSNNQNVPSVISNSSHISIAGDDPLSEGIVGDFNDDDTLDSEDIETLIIAYKSWGNDGYFDERCDLDGDLDIDFWDIVEFVLSWQQFWYGPEGD